MTLAEIRRECWPADGMSYEMACTFTSEKTGARYMDIDSTKLGFHANGLNKQLKENGLTDEQRIDITAKRDAALACIKATPIN